MMIKSHMFRILFHLYTMVYSDNGGSLSLESFRGIPVVGNILFSTYC